MRDILTYEVSFVTWLFGRVAKIVTDKDYGYEVIGGWNAARLIYPWDWLLCKIPYKLYKGFKLLVSLVDWGNPRLTGKIYHSLDLEE